VGGNDTGGTDWTGLLLDGHTIIYDGEGTKLLSYNLLTQTQNPDFTSAATEDALFHIFAFRVIPNGPDAGDVLLANSIDAVRKLLVALWKFRERRSRNRRRNDEARLTAGHRPRHSIPYSSGQDQS
jgi:hypothetical protein